MIRESTLIDREQILTLPEASTSNGPLTLTTHTAIPPILVMLIAPNIPDNFKSFSNIKSSIDYLNQFKDPALLIEDEQVKNHFISSYRNFIINQLII